MSQKSLLIFLFFCFCGDLLAQENQVVRINEIPQAGILLNYGWKYKVGDKPEYASPDFDDSTWDTINPAKDIHDLPMLWKDSVVWFRARIYIDENLLKEQLAFLIQQSGASELYLNGELLESFGVLSSEHSKITAYDPLGKPVSFPINKSGLQIISFRYILQPGVIYKTIFGAHNYGIYLKVNTLESFLKNDQEFTYYLLGPGFLVTGLFFILTILHLSFFWFNRSQKANLFFFIFTLLTVAGFLLNVVSFGITWVEDKFWVFLPAAFLIIVGNLFMVISIYFQLEQKRGTWFWTLVCLYFLVLFSVILPGYWGWELIGQSFQILVNFEIGRITFLAFKRRQQGAKILAIGSVFCFLGWTAFSFFGLPGEVDFFSLLVFNIAFLSIPIAASVNLGVESGITSKLLKNKLEEVETLSKKTIEQEVEKQELLASQNEVLEKQVADRTHDLLASLENLKSTQAQLIQSEKMASLGELTAGIAHEIQNPLNFVNNFSEVNSELIDEQLEEIEKGDLEEIKELAHLLKENSSKITLHGKRADAIVKGMLEHSKRGSGQKEPTDLNALAEEFLRLSYQSFLAKEPEFKAELKLNLDPNLPKVNVIPQDIGKVLLNLYSNAFYALNERAKTDPNFQPLVELTTRNLGGKIEVDVKDNGLGIPDSIKDKIFQPFFTTKPTGEGTGLGLSLAYDIVKAHGGELRVESKEGEGFTLIVLLPIV